MKIAIVTLDGFNEIDSFVALSILSRVKVDGWSVQITAPEKSVTSMNGVEIKARQKLSFANEADVVLFGSGTHTRDHIDNADLIAQFALDPARQLIGAQCSGALFLHRLGFLPATAATDAKTRPLLAATGCLIEDKPLIAQGNIVTAGGCVIARALGLDHALAILEHVAPSGQKSSFVKTAADIIKPQLNVPSQPALYC